jgi:hypothetical protein
MPLNLKAPSSFETPVTTHLTTQRHNTEDPNPQQNRCDSLKSCKLHTATSNYFQLLPVLASTDDGAYGYYSVITVLLCTDTDRTHRETEMHNFEVNLHTLVNAERQKERHTLFTQPVTAGTVTFINFTLTSFIDHHHHHHDIASFRLNVACSSWSCKTPDLSIYVMVSPAHTFLSHDNRRPTV